MQHGDEVVGSGGFHDTSTLSEFAVADGVELALNCVDNQYGEIAVLNSIGE